MAEEIGVELAPGLRLRTAFGQTEGWATYTRVSFSPDGRWLAAGQATGPAQVWDWEKEEVELSIPARVSNDLAWSSSGLLAVAADTGLWLGFPPSEPRLHLEGRVCTSVAVHPDGARLAVGEIDGLVLILEDRDGWQSSGELVGLEGSVRGSRYSPSGGLLASVSSSGELCLWGGGEDEPDRTSGAHGGKPVNRLAFEPSGKWLATAGNDGADRIWDAHTGRALHVLEAVRLHTTVEIAVSPDGALLATVDTGGGLRLWRTDRWEIVASAQFEFPGTPLHPGVAFHPTRPILALVPGDHQKIRLLDYDLPALTGQAAREDTVRYTNAKVVLVGDTGVGKTGLALVLSGQKWRPTGSSHGRHVWTFQRSEKVDRHGVRTIRETFLWDLAGQPGYRLVHQLHLDEVSAALLVFDARSELDPLAGVRYWNRALDQAQRRQGDGAPPLAKLLVEARHDCGGVALSQRRLLEVCSSLGCQGVFRTSAKHHEGTSELKAAIRAAVDWAALPQVTSNEMLASVQRFLTWRRNRVTILTLDQLHLEFRRQQHVTGDVPRPAFDSCVRMLESRGLVRRLSFGDFVLLRPEYLDAYASSIVNAARDEPGGLGSLPEDAARSGAFPMADDARVNDREMEKLLLIATVEDLIRHDVALREPAADGVLLVFPAQLTRENPAMPEPPGKTVVLRFEGAVQNVYTTLVVRLAHSGRFAGPEMWRNAAEFEARVGGKCGIYMRAFENGRAELTVFHDENASEETRFEFEEYVKMHLERRAVSGSIERRRVYICPCCGMAVGDAAVRKRIELGADTVRCNACLEEPEIPLKDSLDRLRVSEDEARVVGEMDRSAAAGRSRDAAVQVIEGKRAVRDYDVFLCHHDPDKPAVKEIGERLIAAGILPWLDEWDLRPGSRWQEEIEHQIAEVKAIAVFVGASGVGPWHNQELRAILEASARDERRVIPVILPGVEEVPDLPIFLRAYTWVDFRKEDPDPLVRLRWGITGES